MRTTAGQTMHSVPNSAIVLKCKLLTAAARLSRAPGARCPVPVSPFLPGALAVNSTTHAVYLLASGSNGTGQVAVINGPARSTCAAVGGAIGEKYAALGGCASF